MLLNPVLRREMIMVLRTWRTFIFVAAYSLMLTVAAVIVLLGISGNAYRGFEPTDTVALSITLIVFQLALILLFVPAISGGAISGERDRQTLDLMLVTKVSTLSIVIGKLTSSLLLIVLMITASLPVYGILMFFNCIAIPDLILISLFSILTAAMVSSLSILMSTLFKRTVIAVVAAYVFMIIIFLGGFVLTISYNYLFSSWTWIPKMSYGLIFALFSINPAIGLLSVFDSQLGYSNIFEMINTAAGYGFVSTAGSQPAVSYPTIPLWVFNMLIDCIFVIICVLLSAKLIKPTGARRRK